MDNLGETKIFIILGVARIVLTNHFIYETI